MAMYTPLLKTSFLLANSLLVYKILTDPNRKPSKLPRQKVRRPWFAELLLKRIEVYDYFKYIYITASLLEILSILPSSTFSPLFDFIASTSWARSSSSTFTSIPPTN
ncbi:hypothetical protein CC2G_011233 [Coprinopsis cinerea AmutBmut pab1-1]|nr:hypothetical protein CC2G_011233 [Coprinopsis cinerea AmutBmut pab1-1]